MNTRRNFFRSLAALAGAASISPQIFIPKFEPVRWKVAAPLPYIVEDLKEFRFWETPSQYPPPPCDVSKLSGLSDEDAAIVFRQVFCGYIEDGDRRFRIVSENPC